MITPRVAQHKHRLSGTVPTISSTVWIGFSSFGPNRDVDKLYKPRILDSVHIVCNSTYKTTNQQPITRTIKVMQASSVVLIPVCVWVTISRSTSTTAPGAAGFNSTPGCAMLPSPALAGTSQEQLAGTISQYVAEEELAPKSKGVQILRLIPFFLRTLAP